VFSDASVNRVIILEEDIEIAPDFYEFFAAVAPMLDTDSTLLAASAFNDNGFNEVVKDNKQLYR
jgi:alpha-1,3-mannosyl-glycoprotein beta-1,2-N-acetylglucosaminyltransferase